MTFEIYKRLEFAAAHQLHGLPPTHQCSRLHGHNYAVEVWLSSETLDGTGFVVDYGVLNVIKEWFDHRYLNDVMGDNPTAELLAKSIHDRLSEALLDIDIRIRVHETPNTWAEYRL